MGYPCDPYTECFRHLSGQDVPHVEVRRVDYVGLSTPYHLLYFTDNQRTDKPYCRFSHLQSCTLVELYHTHSVTYPL